MVMGEPAEAQASENDTDQDDEQKFGFHASNIYIFTKLRTGCIKLVNM